jgi:hypothetical protein
MRRLPHLLLGEQAVLHGEHRGGGPAGGVDLGVDVLDVIAGRLRRDHQSFGYLPVGQAAGEQDEDLDLAGGQAGQGLPAPRQPVPGRLEHGVHRRAVQAAGPDLGSHLRRRVLRRPGRPVRPGLAHRGVRVGGPEHPGRPGDRAAGQPPGVPAAVQPLAVLHRDLAERRQRGRLVQHPLGQVRVHPDPLPLTRAERPGPVPDRVRHAQPAEPVHEPGPAQRPHLLRRQPEPAAGLLGQFRHRDRVPQGERRLQVHEVRDGRQRPVELVR